MLKLPGLHMGVSQLALRSASGVESGVSADPTTSISLGDPGDEAPKAKFSSNAATKTEPTDAPDDEDADDGDPDEGGADPAGEDEGEGDADDPEAPLPDLGEYSDDKHAEFDARYRAEDGSLNEAVLTSEFDANKGKLNDSTYAYFEALGFPKAFVKGQEEALVALREKRGNALVGAVGGEQVLNAAVEWGKKAYTREQRKRFNAIMAGSDQEAKQEALEALVSRHQKATGKGLLGRRRTTPVVSATDGPGSSTTTSNGGYESRDAWLKDRAAAGNDPRKQAEVRRRLQRSKRANWK